MTTRKALILIGGGGHCKACIEVIESTDKYIIHGILDAPSRLGQSVLGYPIVGTDSDAASYIQQGYNFMVTIGQVGASQARTHQFDHLKAAGAIFPVVISPFARVSPHSSIGEGSIIMHGAVINADAQVGANCIINTGAIIEHDCRVGSHVHVSTGAILNGNCEIGNSCFIGSHATLNQQVYVILGTVVGAAALVNRSIHEAGVYVGVPAQKIK